MFVKDRKEKGRESKRSSLRGENDTKEIDLEAPLENTKFS
jgi:hypothetical protein